VTGRPAGTAPEQRGRPAGLYGQLTARLLLPMLCIVAIGSGLGFYMAHRQTRVVFDRWLLDAAVSLAGQVYAAPTAPIGVDLPPAAIRMLVYDEMDDIYFSVQQGPRVLAGQAGMPTAGTQAARYATGDAFDARYLGQPVRVAVVRPGCAGCEEVRVSVAETLHKRDRAYRSQLWFLAPMAVLLSATVAAIYSTLQRTVRPLESLALHWNRESHASLQPIPEQDLPFELLPFASALNHLLARIRTMVENERQFAATAAHQVRTALTGLRLGVERAMAAGDAAHMRRVLAEVGASTDSIARMVQQLLLLGRVDSQGRPTIGAAPVDLVPLIGDVCALQVEFALAKNVALELRAARQPVIVDGHAELIAEAAANLLDNALRATPAGGRVHVAVDAEPPSFSVEDSGPGLLPEERERVFERFFRGSRASWPGTGLGLAIVRDIAAQHGAAVSAGAAESGGARFSVVFPARTAT
jgi:two-component system sensor histidine kinase TctE